MNIDLLYTLLDDLEAYWIVYDLCILNDWAAIEPIIPVWNITTKRSTFNNLTKSWSKQYSRGWINNRTVSTAEDYWKSFIGWN
jgi:hypothetical protein